MRASRLVLVAGLIAAALVASVDASASPEYQQLRYVNFLLFLIVLILSPSCECLFEMWLVVDDVFDVSFIISSPYTYSVPFFPPFPSLFLSLLLPPSQLS